MADVKGEYTHPWWVVVLIPKPRVGMIRAGRLGRCTDTAGLQLRAPHSQHITAHS